jgi:Gly-Xaa carboxypeptidase
MNAKGEKLDILPATVLAQVPPAHPQRPLTWSWWILGFIALVAGAFPVSLRYASLRGELFIPSSDREVADLCPQSNALYPGQHAELWESLGREFDEDAFTTRAVEWLGGAIRIPYVSAISF